MNTGKTLFAQLMDFLPWTTFTRIVDRYGGDHRVRTLSCAEQYRSMAFAQLTYRESLRDIETCLSVHASKLYHMGFRQPVRRSNAGRCQRKARLAYPCGVGPAAHHPGEDAVRRRRTGVGPDQYRLRPGLDDHRSVPVGLSVGALPHHQGGGDRCTRCSTCGATFRVLSTSRMASCTTFMPSICSCRKPEPSTSWIVATSTLPAFMCCTKPGRFFVTACQVEHRCSSRLFGADGSLDRHHLRPDHLPGRLLHPSGLPRTSAAHPLQGPRVRQDAGLHHQQLLASGRHHLRALQKPLAGGTLLQVDQAASSDQAVLRHDGELRSARLRRSLGFTSPPAHVHRPVRRQEKPRSRRLDSTPSYRSCP